MAYMYGANVLENSDEHAGRGAGKNSPPQGQDGVDWDVQFNLVNPLTGTPGGICSGITSAWIIAFLSAKDDPEKNVHRFPSFFANALQFQGAYMKMLHGTADRHIERYGERGDIGGIRMHSKKIGGHLRPFLLPKGGWWAAYWSCVGHAIGLGCYNYDPYYIMEPNVGLFVYKSKIKFLGDVNGLADARYARTNSPVPSSSFYFYARGSWTG